MTDRDLVETIEVPPQQLGWRPLGNREWVHEDGRKIIFAPGAPQVFLVLYRAQIRDLFNEPPSVKAYGS